MQLVAPRRQPECGERLRRAAERRDGGLRGLLLAQVAGEGEERGLVAEGVEQLGAAGGRAGA